MDVTNEWHAKTGDVIMARIFRGGITRPPKQNWGYDLPEGRDEDKWEGGMTGGYMDDVVEPGHIQTGWLDEDNTLTPTEFGKKNTPYGQLFSEIGGAYDPNIEQLFRDVHGDRAEEVWIRDRRRWLDQQSPAELDSIQEQTGITWGEPSGGMSTQDFIDMTEDQKTTFTPPEDIDPGLEGLEESWFTPPEDIDPGLEGLEESWDLLTDDGDQQTLSFVDAQKAAGWQYYEDLRREADPNYQHQVNPYTNSKDSAAVPPIPEETYNPDLLQGHWDELQNMAYIVREVAALGLEGAKANYPHWSDEDIAYAEWQLENYAKDFPSYSGTTGDTTATGDTTTATSGPGSGNTGQPNAGRSETAGGDAIIDWAPDVYGHTERDMGASYVKEGGFPVDGWWTPYLPTELNPDSVFLTVTNALMPFLSQTDRQLMGNQLNIFNNEAFPNYNAIPKAIVGSEDWDEFFNGSRWRDLHATLKNVESHLLKMAGGDKALQGTALMPLRWLINAVETLQAFVGDGITRLDKEQFKRNYDSLIAVAEQYGAAGLDQVFNLIVSPYIPGADSFWDESPNVAIL